MLKRRDFLRATLIAAGALIVPGCGDETSPGEERQLEDGAAYFPQSVASGDPRPESVILWTRVEDADQKGADLDVELEVATDEAFGSKLSLDAAKSKLKAAAKHDGCVKVKLTGLKPGTAYYYRFIYSKGGKFYATRVGRTKTAPDAGADVAVKFAYISCQDYIGRFYNAHIALAEEEVDFVVHLGDYIYETTGDPSFQSGDPSRQIDLADKEGAIALVDGDVTYYAAASVDNYRQVYRSYRGDANLQRVHERFPMIAIWDDHEYSNDCWGATATYFNGAKDEHDEARRKNANQVWTEFQPVDFGDDGSFEYDPSKPYPTDLTIYRDFQFGKHVHLVMTDLRTYRADHLVPEGALPGAIAVTEAELTEELGSLPPTAIPYVDIESYQGGIYKQALVGAAATAGYEAGKVTGNISVSFINTIVTKVNETLPPNMQIPLIDDAEPSLKKGFAFSSFGKAGIYGAAGSRFFVIKDTFDVYSRVLYKKDPKRQEVMGADQEAWFLKTMGDSGATWKVWGNEYCLTQLAIDLSNLKELPASLQRAFYMLTDDWDGFREKRSELIGKLSGMGNVVAITGDVHSFYASTPTVNDDPKKKIVEIVGSSISSMTLKSIVITTLQTDPVLSQVTGAEALAQDLDGLFLDTETKINPHLGYAQSQSNGYVIVEANGNEFLATMHRIGEKEVTTDYSGKAADLLKRMSAVKFRVVPGERELYQEIGGAWKKWDMETQSWV